MCLSEYVGPAKQHSNGMGLTFMKNVCIAFGETKTNIDWDFTYTNSFILHIILHLYVI